MRTTVIFLTLLFTSLLIAEETGKQISCETVTNLLKSYEATHADTTITYDTAYLPHISLTVSDSTGKPSEIDSARDLSMEITADTSIQVDTNAHLLALQAQLDSLCTCDTVTEDPKVETPEVSYVDRNKLNITIKGLGSPISKTGNILGRITLATDFNDISQMTNSFYAGWEATSDSTSDYRFGGSSNMAFFMGGQSKERFTTFVNFAAFRDTKKGIDDQEDLIVGGGLAIIGNSFRKDYILKYSVGVGGKFQEKIDEFDVKQPREQAPIIDNRIKLKLLFFESEDRGVGNFSYEGVYRHIHALNNGSDYQFSFGNKLMLDFQNGQGLFVAYLAEYDNESTKDLWTDLVTIGFSSDIGFGKRATEK